jgi:hypothetical protein
MTRALVRLTTWAGLWVGALLWASNMQLGLILPFADCTRQGRASALMSMGFAILALIAGIISWRSARSSPSGFGSPSTLRFDAAVSALSAPVFTFALGLQAIASLVLTGCER